MPIATETAPKDNEAPAEERPIFNANTFPTILQDVEIDPDRHFFAQIKESAPEEQKDLVGFVWQDESGVHRVRNHGHFTKYRTKTHKIVEVEGLKSWPIIIPKVKETNYRRVSLPRLKFRGGINHGPVIEREKVYDVEPEAAEYWTVDTIGPGGLLYGVQTFEAYGNKNKPETYRNTFEEYFYMEPKENKYLTRFKLPKVPRNVTYAGWTNREPAPEPEATETMPVELEGTSISFKSLIDLQERYGLNTWKGLAWKSEERLTYKDNHKQDQAQVTRITRQIISDRVVINKNMYGIEYPERMFEVVAKKENGDDLYHQFYSAATLEATFKFMAKPNTPTSIIEMYWMAPPEEERLRQVGEAALGEDAQTDENDRNISPEDAWNMLRPAFPPTAEGHAEAQAYIEKLRQTIADVGLSKFNSVASKIHNSYMADLMLLGIPTSMDEGSFSLFVQDLVTYHSEAEEGKNPFHNDESGRSLRLLIGSYRLGQRTRAAYIVDTKTRVPDWDGEEPAEKTVHIYKENPTYRNRLQKLIYKDKVVTNLRKRQASEEPPLSPQDDYWLGLWIKRSFGSNN